jgi:beta-mannanase
VRSEFDSARRTIGKRGSNAFSNLVEVWKILSLCLFVPLFAIACREQSALSAPESFAHVRVPVHLILPEQRAYTGAYMDFGQSEDDVTVEKITAFEKAVGKRQAIIASSSFWGEQTFPSHNLELTTRQNAIPLVYWSPWDKPYAEARGPDRFSLDAIVSGRWDAYIDSWAAKAKTFGHPIFVAWGLEMNGTWFPWSGYFYGGGKQLSQGTYAGPDLFKKAYRHVVDRVRANGAQNIIWVFHIQDYSYPSDEWNQPEEYYPGDDYVDWLAMSAFGKQFRRDKWVSASDVMRWAYEDLCLISPKKPIMFAEWGVGEYPDSGDKAQWIREAFQLMKTRFPRLKAAVFWSERWENDDGTYSDLRVTSSPEALQAYRKGVADPFWLDHPIYR